MSKLCPRRKRRFNLWTLFLAQAMLLFKLYFYLRGTNFQLKKLDVIFEEKRDFLSLIRILSFPDSNKILSMPFSRSAGNFADSAAYPMK